MTRYLTIYGIFVLFGSVVSFASGALFVKSGRLDTLGSFLFSLIFTGYSVYRVARVLRGTLVSNLKVNVRIPGNSSVSISCHSQPVHGRVFLFFDHSTDCYNGTISLKAGLAHIACVTLPRVSETSKLFRSSFNRALIKGPRLVTIVWVSEGGAPGAFELCFELEHNVSDRETREALGITNQERVEIYARLLR